MRNCVKRKNYVERVVQTCCCCAPTFHPIYVVTCNIFVLYCSWQTQIPLGELTALSQTTLTGFKGATSLPTCLWLTLVALCQRVRSVITRTRYINVLTNLLTYISNTIGCRNFGPDWPLLFKVHEI